MPPKKLKRTAIVRAGVLTSYGFVGVPQATELDNHDPRPLHPSSANDFHEPVKAGIRRVKTDIRRLQLKPIVTIIHLTADTQLPPAALYAFHQRKP